MDVCNACFLMESLSLKTVVIMFLNYRTSYKPKREMTTKTLNSDYSVGIVSKATVQVATVRLANFLTFSDCENKSRGEYFFRATTC